MRKRSLGVIFLGLVPAAGFAMDNSSNDHSGIYVGPMLDLGYDYGGEKICTVVFTDGSQQNLRAGSGGLISGGVHARLYRDSPFDLRASIGFKFDSAGASNASVDFNRVTYELMPSVRLPYGIWAGIGVIHESNIKLKSDGFTPGLDVPVKSATGPNFELGWRSRTYRFVDYGFALVYTSIKYEDDFGDRFSGDSIGLRANVNFGWRVFGSAPTHPSESPIAIVPVDTSLQDVAAPAPPVAAVASVPMAPAGSGKPLSTPFAKNQVVLLSGARDLRRQPKASSTASVALPAGTPVTLDAQVGDFWFVKTDTTAGWLTVGELQ